MKNQGKTSTSGNKPTVKSKQKSARVRKGIKAKFVKKTTSKRQPSAKLVKKKKVAKKRKVVKKASKKKAMKKGEEHLPEDVKWLEDDPHDEILSRFIYNSKGAQVGETIGVEGKQLILKNREKFYSIPLNFIHEKNNELVLKKNVNWDNAEKKGEKWRKKSLDVIKRKK
jgi:hypothetical protein